MVSMNKTAEEGEKITMTCRADHTEWNRKDLKTGCVFKKGRGQDPDSQHPSYRGRVDLPDPQMKNGDMSLALKDMKGCDTGVYECQHERGGFGHEPICTINLTVRPKGTKEGQMEEPKAEGSEVEDQ